MSAPKEFIDKVRRLLPNQTLLHQRLAEGNFKSCWRMLSDTSIAAEKSLKPSIIVTLLEQGKADELLEQARIQKELSELYREFQEFALRS